VEFGGSGQTRRVMFWGGGLTEEVAAKRCLASRQLSIKTKFVSRYGME
jgi:hypothetical protein